MIGFIGLGTTGRNAALNGRRAGFGMVIYDIRAEVAEPLLVEGAALGQSPADVLNRSDVVVTMVFGSEEIERK